MASFLSTLITVGFFIFVILALASTAIKIVKEYERGVIFRLGRLVGAKVRAFSSSSLLWTSW